MVLSSGAGLESRIAEAIVRGDEGMFLALMRGVGDEQHSRVLSLLRQMDSFPGGEVVAVEGGETQSLAVAGGVRMQESGEREGGHHRL
jgi:hypothetical protein